MTRWRCITRLARPGRIPFQPTSRRGVSSDFAEICPTEAFVAAYRKAATLLHPDKHGGNGPGNAETQHRVEQSRTPPA